MDFYDTHLIKHQNRMSLQIEKANFILNLFFILIIKFNKKSINKIKALILNNFLTPYLLILCETDAISSEINYCI